jgi:alkaline phosphatase D
MVPLRVDLGSLPFQDYQDGIFSVDAWAGFPWEQRLLLSHLQQHGVTGLVSLSGDHHMHAAGTVSASAADPDSPPLAVDFSVAGISSTPIFEDVTWVARNDNPDFEQLVIGEKDGVEIPLWNMTLLDGVLAAVAYDRTGLRELSRWLGPNTANPGLNYVDTEANGYALARFSAAALQVDMLTMAQVRVPFDTPPEISRSAHFNVASWQAGQAPVIQGPAFSGIPPFPFAPQSV